MNNTYGWTIIKIYASLGLHWFQTIDGAILFTLPDDHQWRTPTDAQIWCTRNQSKLLEVTSDSIQSSVVTFIKNAISQNQMTENSVITNGKRYSNSTFAWVNGHPISSRLQIKGQEPGFSHSYGYLNQSLSGNAVVADTPTATRGYICEGSSFCSGGFKLNERCYKSYSDTLSWFGARNRCLDGGGGDLASFEFIVDAQGLSALNGLGLNQPSTYWVGLQRQWWTWQGSSSEVRYSQWSDGHPDYANNSNEECLCLNPNNPTYDWKWIECDCSRTYQFVCLADTPSTSSASSSTSVSTVHLISSTQIKTGAITSQPVNSPPSISVAGGLNTTALAVGLGLGIPMAIIILILSLVIVQQRRKIKRFLGFNVYAQSHAKHWTQEYDQLRSYTRILTHTLFGNEQKHTISRSSYDKQRGNRHNL